MKQQMILGVVASALGLVFSLAPAHAQGRAGAQGGAMSGQRQGGRPGGGRPGGHRPPGNGSYWVPGPSMPASGPAALIERDFQMMRNSVRRPDKFLYGQFNPSYQLVTPTPNYYPPTGGYYPYYSGGYGTGIYYGGYGNGFGYGYGGQSPLVQQDFYYVQGGDGFGGGNGYVQGQSQPQRAQPRRDTPPTSDDVVPAQGKDDFYLRSGGNATAGQVESLTDALDDIRKAWLNGDFDRLKARIATDAKVKIYPGGQYRYSQKGSEFASMLHEAMARIDTLSFEFERPKSDAAGHAFVTGKHTFNDSAGKRQETFVSYGLERSGGRWRIIEAGSASTPIARHEDAAAGGQTPRPEKSVKPQGSGQ